MSIIGERVVKTEVFSGRKKMRFNACKFFAVFISLILIFSALPVGFLTNVMPAVSSAAAAKAASPAPPYPVTLGEDATLTAANLHGVAGTGDATSYGQTAAATSSVGQYQEASASAYVGARFSVEPGGGATSADAQISFVFSYNAAVDFNAVPPDQNGGGSAQAKIEASIAGAKQTVEQIAFIHNAGSQQTADTTTVTTTATLQAGESYNVVADLMTQAQIYIGTNALARADVTIDRINIKFLPPAPPPPPQYTVTLGQDATFTAANIYSAFGGAEAGGQDASSTQSLGPNQNGQSEALIGIGFSVLPGPDLGRTQANADIAITFRYHANVDFDPLPLNQGGGGSAEAKIETLLPGPFRTIWRENFVDYAGSAATSDTTTIARIVSPMNVGGFYQALAKVYTRADVYAGNSAVAHADVTIEQVTVKFYSSEPLGNPDPYVVTLGQDATLKTSNIHGTSGDEAAAADGQTATATVSVGPQESGIANAVVGSRFYFAPGAGGLNHANANVSVTFSYNVEVDHNALTGDGGVGGGGSGDANVRTNVMGWQEFHEDIHNSTNVFYKKGTGAKTVTYAVDLNAGETRDVYAAVYAHADIYAGVLSVAHGDVTIDEIKIDFADTGQGAGVNQSPQPAATEKQAVATKLTLLAKPKAAKVGAAIILRGRLVDLSGKGVAAKKIKIKAGKKTIGTAMTGKHGFYKLARKISKRTVFKAVFAGDDHYKRAVSKAVSIRIKR